VILIYDAKCKFCRSLATKIQFSAGRAVEILALSDPAAIRLLDGFYPKGWEHDFYVVDGDRVARGGRALPRLAGALGPRRTVAMLGEYATYRTAKKSCHAGTAKAHDHAAHDHAGHDHAGTSRRQLLKYGAMTPLVAGLGKLPKLDQPNVTSVPGLVVNIAEVTKVAGAFVVTAYASPESVLQEAEWGPSTDTAGKSVTTLEENVLFDAGAVRIRHSKTLTERPAVPPAEMDVYNGFLDASRYSITANTGFGPVRTLTGREDKATMSGMVLHDQAVPVVDYVLYRPDQPDTVDNHFAAYAAALTDLAVLHAAAGRPAFSELYAEIASGLVSMGGLYAVHTPVYRPSRNKLTITSRKDLLKFTKLPAVLSSTDEGGCDCKCDCDCCCGCGCGCHCSFCDGCFCDCECCCGCGCDCGCGCCAG
jgi:hypothetical protein